MKDSLSLIFTKCPWDLMNIGRKLKRGCFRRIGVENKLTSSSSCEIRKHKYECSSPIIRQQQLSTTFLVENCCCCIISRAPQENDHPWKSIDYPMSNKAPSYQFVISINVIKSSWLVYIIVSSVYCWDLKWPEQGTIGVTDSVHTFFDPDLLYM